MEYGDVWVEGEISNFKRHRSGHCYFTLKDEDAQVRCVMWRHFTRYVFFEPQDGMLVRVHGGASRSEERRVGKEGRSRCGPARYRTTGEKSNTCISWKKYVTQY